MHNQENPPASPHLEIAPLAGRRDAIPLLARWHHAQWGSFNPGETLDDRVARLEKHAADNHLPLTWVASRGAAILGSASLVASDLESRPLLTPWLASVFVAPEHRRAGIGGLLVERVQREAAARGFKRIYLFTPDRQTFYERLGWQLFEDLEHHHTSVSLMSLDLDA